MYILQLNSSSWTVHVTPLVFIDYGSGCMYETLSLAYFLYYLTTDLLLLLSLA